MYLWSNSHSCKILYTYVCKCGVCVCHASMCWSLTGATGVRGEHSHERRRERGEDQRPHYVEQVADDVGARAVAGLAEHLRPRHPLHTNRRAMDNVPRAWAQCLINFSQKLSNLKGSPFQGLATQIVQTQKRGRFILGLY